MLKETNLDGVKSVARMLLMIPIHKTPYSPAVVQHPFTSCGIASLNKDGKFQLLDIMAKEEDLKIWQEFMKSKIDEAENVWEIYAFINKPYTLTFLKFAEPYLSKEDFSKILGDAWVRSENPNDDPNFTKRDLIAMFKRADKQSLMTEEDYKRAEKEMNGKIKKEKKSSGEKKKVRSLHRIDEEDYEEPKAEAKPKKTEQAKGLAGMIEKPEVKAEEVKEEAAEEAKETEEE